MNGVAKIQMRREKERERDGREQPPNYAFMLRTSCASIYDGVSKSSRTGRLERELQMVQLSATRCNCIAILWVTLVSFAAIPLCIASQWVIPNVSVYFIMTQSGNFWIHPRKYSTQQMISAIKTLSCIREVCGLSLGGTTDFNDCVLHYFPPAVSGE
jgi:hypothetical protein